MTARETQSQIKEFIDHLLNVSSIRSETALRAEGQILSFIFQNKSQLEQTFRTPQYFPSLSWDDVLKMIYSELYARSAEHVLTHFNGFINSSDFTFMNKFPGGSALPNDFHREKLSELVAAIFKNAEARFNYNGAYNIFKEKILENYLGESFKRRDSLYNELVRVQKTYLECDEYITFLKVLLLVRNAAYLKIPSAAGAHNINMFESAKIPGKLTKYLDEAAVHFRQIAPNCTDRVMKLAFKSHLKKEHTDLEDASSRFIYILCSRFNNYTPVKTVDRGAESPDKSWFSVARKNSDYLGFDRRMLEVLYQIAGENNW